MAMRPDWKSYPWLQISLVSYLVACCVPALELTTTSPENLIPVAHAKMWGFQLLLRGFMGVFTGTIGWFANPLWAVALLLVFFKRLKAALFVSLLSVAIALSSITVIGRDLAVWESDPYHQRVSALLPGFFVWIASLALVPLTCWLKMKGSKQETTLKSD
jgi:hypothetical protein